MKVLITGSSGFIGKHTAGLLEANNKLQVVGLDKKDIQEGDLQKNLLTDYHGCLERVDVVVHMAAETFVDKSVHSPECFIQNNVVATFNLLEEARKYKPKKFIYVSTDEVYGSIEKGLFAEDAPLNPGNPYSATKACGEMLCKAYHNTYGVPIVIVRPENNYGYAQHQQKAIPTWIKHCLENRPLPLYGDGKHRRMWLRVEDMASAIETIIFSGKIGETYNIGGYQEHANIDVVNKICEILGVKPSITYIPDDRVRKGHDRRYGIDCERIRSLGWSPKYTLESGLEEVVNWFKTNDWWLR